MRKSDQCRHAAVLIMLHQTFAGSSVAARTSDRARDRRIIAGTAGFSTLYATLRYNVFKGVPWSDWPHFVGNKALALSALILIALAVFRLVARRPRPIRRLMATGSAMALVHTLISLALCRPEYFDKFFAGPKLSLAGGASMLLGAIAMAILNWGRGRAGSSLPVAAAVPLAAVAFLSGAHAALPSASTWLAPATWPGHLPPITLISFVAGCLAIAGLLRRLAKFGPTTRSNPNRIIDREAGG